MVGGAGYEAMLLSSSFLKQGNLNYIIPVVINNQVTIKFLYFYHKNIYRFFLNPLEYDKNMKKLIFLNYMGEMNDLSHLLEKVPLWMKKPMMLIF